MKKRFSILLLAIFLLNTTGTLWIMTAFYLQQDYIAQNLCENRFTEQTTCNGKCHLTKRLKEKEEKEQETVELKTNEILLFVQQEIIVPTFNVVFISKEENVIPQQSEIASGHAVAIFQPPRIA